MTLSLRSKILDEMEMSVEDLERFKRVAHPERWAPDQCVHWEGPAWHPKKAPNQMHGKFYWGSLDDPLQMPAHRLAYTLYRGDIPEGHYALHKCPNGPTNQSRGACVNAYHIESGTWQENYVDRYKDGTAMRQMLSYDDTLACYADRATLTPEERSTKYGVKVSWLKRLDNGITCALVTGAKRTERKRKIVIDIDDPPMSIANLVHVRNVPNVPTQGWIQVNLD